ncbi:FHA domain-containing protein [Mycobacterium aquaticum]|uniref:FHA domain-containing protein n=1 Tax=Mycobacterium aquaticum TaxID=1927124 RepID=A0A1X0B0P4_9MYCO|nr:FHA domain-containing protein [Mycobacterium aquaticum]ORA35921.1 FHA domain-containing protein [Mycobacterium aquaticum]
MSTTQNHPTSEYRIEDTTGFLTPPRETIEVAATALEHLDTLPPGAAMLVVKRGPNIGLRFVLHQPITTAGRHPRSDIYLDDITVSRLHAEFHCDEGEFQIIDTNSLNGTYVNRQPVDCATLTDGDEIQIGNFRLLFFTSTATS